MDISVRVIKEPRGFIRVIQFVMAILAFSTTAGFSTTCKFSIDCKDEAKDREISYELHYPFRPPELSVPREDCTEDYNLILPFTYSTAAEFFVATGVICFLYTIIIMVTYIFFHQTYTENTKLPVIDLGITAVLSVFWLAGSSAWAQGVTDFKYYLHPDRVFILTPMCIESIDKCKTLEDGSYGVLNASLILGFANFLLWTCSLWFVYKETAFHAPDVVTDTNQSQQLPKGVGKV